MRFLLLSTSYYPATKMGGPLHSVRSLAEALVARGHEVTVVAPNRDLLEKLDVDTRKDHWVDGVRVRYFDTYEAAWAKKLPGLQRNLERRLKPGWKQWLKENIDSFDVLDIQMTFLNFAPLAARLARKHNKVLFYHQRGVLDPLRLQLNKWRKSFYIRFIERNVLKRCSVLVALTQYEAESFRLLGLNRPIAIIANGVDANYGDTPAKPDDEIAALIESFGSRPVFMWMSRIHKIKGGDVFVDAFINAASRNGEIVGVLAGPDENGLEADLKERIAKAGLEDRFHFTGPLSGDNKIAMLKRSDVFVFPTMTEGFSMALLEALACNCAILTSKGAYFDEIAEARAGWILERTSEAYAEAMLKLLKENCTLIREFANNGRTLVQEHYTWDVVADRYQELAAAQLADSAGRRTL